jgi:SET and MYND domain-containing protein
MEELLQGFPVALKQVLVGGGRGVFAKRAVKSGEIILRSAPAGVSVHRKHYPLLCLSCLKFSEDIDQIFPHGCEACQTVYYCSEQCKKNDYPLHFAHCELLHSVEVDKDLKKEETSLVRLLFRMLARSSYAKLTAKKRACSGAEAEGENEEIGKISVPPACVRHVELMMEDNRLIAGYKRRKRQRLTAAKAFVKLLRTTSANAKSDSSDGCAASGRQLLPLVEQLTLCPSFQNVRKVERLLASGPLNEFALWDLEEEACGSGFFPGAGLINHSCIPSSAVQLEGTDLCFYATTDIEEGEEITQSYANLNGDGRLSRQENLMTSWGFVCKCIRCEYENYVKSNTGTIPNSVTKTQKIIEKFDRLHVCNCGGISCPLDRRGSRSVAPSHSCVGGEKTESPECDCNCYNLLRRSSAEV